MAEILVAWGPGETRLALVEQGQPVEFVIARADLVAGSIFLGRVADNVPKLDAAFVELGLARPGFLPGGKGKVQGEAILVQVRADAHGAKGPVLTADVSLAGRFLAYSPLRPGVNVSRRLDAPTRERLAAQIGALAHGGEGVVVRTSAALAQDGELEADLAALRADWAAIEAVRNAATAPALLWRADPMARLLAAHPQVERVLVDDAALYAVARRRFGSLVEQARGPAFEMHDCEDAFQAALEPVVALPGGGSVIIEPTAALTAIDVDSGALRAADANAQAVEVIARHLRLRAIGGQIAVDFVSGGGKGALAKLAAALKSAVANDPVPTHVFGVSPLGLVEMTRERHGPSLADLMLERGQYAGAEAAAFAALRRAVAEAAHRPGRALAIAVAPDVAAALARRPEAVTEAETRIGRPLAIRPDPARSREDITVEEVRP